MQARGFYSLAERLLTDGLGRGYLDEVAFGHTLDDLVRRFGGEVEWGGQWPDHELTPPDRGLWLGDVTEDDYPLTGRQSWDAEPYEDWWTVPDASVERNDPEHLVALAEEARRQGRPDDEFRGDPVLRSMITEDERRRDLAERSMLTRLVYGRQLIEETTNLADLPPAPGMTPPAQERLTRVAPLMQLAVSVLEEEFHPGRLSPTEVTGQLQAIVQPLGLKIV